MLRNPATVIEGFEVERVPQGYRDGLLGSLGEGGGRIRESESMVGDTPKDLV